MLNQILKIVVLALTCSFSCRHTDDTPLGKLEDIYRQPKNAKFSHSQTADNLIRAMVDFEGGIQSASYQVDENGELWIFFDVDVLNNINRLQTKKVRLSGMTRFGIANHRHRFRVDLEVAEDSAKILVNGVWLPYRPKNRISFGYYGLFNAASHIKIMLRELQVLGAFQGESFLP